MLDAAIEACTAGWHDTARRTRVAKQLGLAIDDATASAIATQLAAANGDRRRYTLPLADVVRALHDASTAEVGLAVRHGGRGGKFAMTLSTLALAVKPVDRDEVVLAIGTCPARGPSPGAIWKPLAPWQQDLARNVAKAQRWIATQQLARIPIVARAKLSLRQSQIARHALLEEVLARPDDDAPRLVYADWLTNRGDPRGELIAVQCALATRRTQQLLRREKELLRKHGGEWMVGARQLARACEMRRGFVASIEMTARQFAAAGELFRTEPVEQLTLLEPDARKLATLPAAPHFARLRALSVDGSVWLGTAAQTDALRTFLRALGHLHEIALVIRFGDAPDLAALFDGLAWPSAQTVRIGLRPSFHTHLSQQENTARIAAARRVLVRSVPCAQGLGAG